MVKASMMYYSHIKHKTIATLPFIKSQPIHLSKKR